MSFITTILEQNKEYESPLSFWYWSGLAAISAVVKDNIWVNRHLFNTYPNIYVILYADSGVGKGPPVSLANKLVMSVGNTKLINGRSSIQGILKVLGSGETKPGGKIESNSTAFICSSELSASLVEDKAALDILTDLYDRLFRHGKYESLLKMEQFTINNPTITLLGGINEAHAANMFSIKDVQGGFIARSFIVHESEKNTINALIDPPAVLPDHNELVSYLKELAELRGPFVELKGTPAGTIYKDWYHKFHNQIRESGAKDPTGTVRRLGENVMKVAMLLSIAHDPVLFITPEAMEEAIVQCEKLVGNARIATANSIGKKEGWVEHKNILIRTLIEREQHSISRAQFLKDNWPMANSKEWDIVASSLEDAGVIGIQVNGPHVFYTMNNTTVEYYSRFFKGKIE